MDAFSTVLYFISLFLALFALALYLYSVYWAHGGPIALSREHKNPVLEPNSNHYWESEAVFNPAAFVHDNKVHLLYRAVGRDGVSRVGYAVSDDGLHFKRSENPAYDPSMESLEQAAKARQDGPKKLSYETLTYDRAITSGGGWGGSEDPRAVIIDDQVIMTFTAFEGWQNVRMTLTSMSISDLERGLFNWSKGVYLSPPGSVNKNWVIFPEKIRGKYALIHNIYPDIEIAYFDPKSIADEGYIKSRFVRKAREGHWDTWIRGAGAPPLKTKDGWLLLYHAIDEKEPNLYKVGAMLLDLKDPKKVLYRSSEPILEPEEWYENDWKPGVVYATGAVVFNGDLLVYYGGGDKFVALARHNLDDFLHKLTHHQHAAVEPVTIK